MPKRKASYEPESEPAYDVEYIRRARVTEDEVWEYHIKWGGYPEEVNSWEPEEHLTGCRRMVKAFWDQVGPHFKTIPKILPAGYVVEPSTLWIARQRKTYRKSVAKKPRLKGFIVEDKEEELRSGIPEASEEFQGEVYLDTDDIPLSIETIYHEVDDDMSSDVSPSANETSSITDHKRSEERTSSDHKPLDGVVIPDSAAIGSQFDNNNGRSSGSNSPSDSLLGDSNTDSDTLSASKSTTPALLAPAKPKLSESPDRPLDTTSRKSLPEHQWDRMNPLVKEMPLFLESCEPLGISTKARISGSSTEDVGPRSADSTLGTSSPSIRSSPPTATSNVIASEVPKPIQLSTSTEFDAPRWLKENIVLTESFSNSSALPSSTSDMQSLHFSKPWRWTGQLAVGDNESEDAFAEPVGEILVTDNIPLDFTAELGIQQLIPSHVDSLCFRHSYPLAMLLATIVDFRISQFARMSANQSNEENSFNCLVAYMTKYELFSQTPLFIGDRSVATMFAFPACFEHLWDQLGVPSKARQSHDLLVAIGFQVYESPRGALGGFMEIYSSDWKSYIKPETVPETSSLDCNRALQALTFPDILYTQIAQKECALFTAPADKESPDTLALTTILHSVPGCKIVPILTGSTRFIFIHVGAWDILHKLIGLVDRRRRRQDVQFYTFGSDPMVEPKHWGVHEVFPTGGVVTFTPRAIAEDPEGVEKLISKLDEHPLWACYVLPSVVAMIIDVVKSDNGPNSKLKGAVDALCGILIPIEKGQIALTWRPPSSRAWHMENTDDTELTPKCKSWMVDQKDLSELRGHDLVLECQKRLHRFPDRTENDIEARIVEDMLVMQSELRRVYRHFVIITDSTGANAPREVAATASANKADIKDGLEFVHVDQFTFGDDYIFADS